MELNNKFNNGKESPPWQITYFVKFLNYWLWITQNLRERERPPKPETKPRTHFYPSELAYCDREIYHRWKSKHKPRYKPRTLRMFEDGVVSEGRYTRYFKEMNILVSNNEKIPFNPSFSGKHDHMVNMFGLTFINEFKRVESKIFSRLKDQGKPVFSHCVQLNIYLWACKLKWGLILYEERDSLDLLGFPFRQNEGLLKWTFEKTARLRNYIDSDVEPPLCRPNGRWVCFYCYPRKQNGNQYNRKCEDSIIKPSQNSTGVLGWMDTNHIQPNK